MAHSAFQKHNESRLPWPFWAGALFLLIIAIGWLLESPGREELFGDTGKLWDMFRANGASWTPNYLLGHSSMVYSTGAIATFFTRVFIYLFGWFFGTFITLKLLILCFIPACAIGMWLLMRKLGASDSMSWLAALLYMVLPSIQVAIGVYEHWTVGLCFVFVPLILRGILAVAEESSPREIVGLGLAASALALSYTKIAVVIAPILILWTLEALRQNPANIRRALIGYGFALVVAALTAILILLPGSREFGFAAGFLFDPVDGWKHHYAFKTPLLWIDLWGFLTKGSPELMGDAQMFQIGLVPLVAVSLALSLSSLA